MENDEKIMTGEQSLRIITDMINKTKFDIRRGIFYLLFWGWLIFICSLSDYLLEKLTFVRQHYYVWMLVVPGVLVSLIYGWVKGRHTKVQTYTGNVYMWTWMGFLISATILFILQSRTMGTVSPYILLLVGFASFISGFLIKFRPLILGSITFWLFSLIIYFAGYQYGSLLSAVAMLTGYIIPGYILKYRVDHGAF